MHGFGQDRLPGVLSHPEGHCPKEHFRPPFCPKAARWPQPANPVGRLYPFPRQGFLPLRVNRACRGRLPGVGSNVNVTR
jgi:hypothetical protein